MEKVIEGAYEVLSVFDQVEEKRDAMQSLMLPPPAQQALAKAALTCRRVRHMTDGLSPLFVMPNEYRTVFM